MKKILYVFVMLMLLLNINVKAADTCTKEELARLKELASKVEINYDYEFKEVKQNGEILGYPVFSLTATNLNSDLKVMIIENYLEQKYKEFKDGDKTSATIKNFKEGDKVNITIKAFVPNKCSGKTVGSKTIKFPYYNKYSEESTCVPYLDFKYCATFTENIITRDIFERELEKYIESQNNTDIPETNDENDSTILIIIGSIAGSVIILLGITAIIVKRKRKNSL